MKFKVDSKLFEILPDVSFGVVVARSVDNRKENRQTAVLLENAVQSIHDRLDNSNVRQVPQIAVYRNAFQRLGYNPNKFMCSIEALVKRILKGGKLPLVNTAVDLGNAISLKHILPIGAHDIQASEDDIEIRFAMQGDTFVPFGKEDSEAVAEGELVYARGHSVKTRKWIWRQGMSGMITEKSTDIFYPIDGFTGVNDAAVRYARDELAHFLGKMPGCEVSIGWVDSNNREMAIE